MELKLTEVGQLTDEHMLTGVTRRGSPIPFYDDGFGPLFIHRDSMGITGVVRAQTWSDAYSICENELFPPGDEDAQAEMERIAALPEGEEKNSAQTCFDEAYGFRDGTRADGSSIYAKDLNGDTLDRLTDRLVQELELELAAQVWADPPPEQHWHVWHLIRRPMRYRIFLVLWSGRYGTRGSRVCAGYRATMRQLTRHDSAHSLQEFGPPYGVPEFNPDGDMPRHNPRVLIWSSC